jgi:hypothetical protein
MDEIGSGSCPVADCGIYDNEASVCTTRDTFIIYNIKLLPLNYVQRTLLLNVGMLQGVGLSPLAGRYLFLQWNVAFNNWKGGFPSRS